MLYEVITVMQASGKRDRGHTGIHSGARLDDRRMWGLSSVGAWSAQKTSAGRPALVFDRGRWRDPVKRVRRTGRA